MEHLKIIKSFYIDYSIVSTDLVEEVAVLNCNLLNKKEWRTKLKLIGIEETIEVLQKEYQKNKFFLVENFDEVYAVPPKLTVQSKQDNIFIFQNTETQKYAIGNRRVYTYLDKDSYFEFVVKEFNWGKEITLYSKEVKMIDKIDYYEKSDILEKVMLFIEKLFTIKIYQTFECD